MRKSEIGRLLCQEEVAPATYRLVAELPELAAVIRPGQFLHVRSADGWDPLLRRPFSPSRVWPERGEVEMIYRVVGRGTELLSRLRSGDKVDVLGPLGSTFTLTGELLLVGGGVGIAPLMYAAQVADPARTTVIIGGRNEEELFWRHLFPQGVREMLTATDDGSFGHHGFSTELVPEVLAAGRFDRVLTCGPTPMMRKVTEMAAAAGVACEVSLERRMGCGTGGCLACVCDKRAGGHAKVCQDGPVFAAEEVYV